MSFKPAFSLSSFALIKSFFSSSSLSANRVVSSSYLRLLLFFSAIWFQLVIYPIWHCELCTLLRLNKLGDNVPPCHTPFPVLNQSVVPCLVLTVACWHIYRFLRRQIRWDSTPISLRFFYNLLWSLQSKALAQSMKQK